VRRVTHVQGIDANDHANVMLSTASRSPHGAAAALDDAQQMLQAARAQGVSMPEHDAARLLRLVTDEIWNRRRYELVNELISDDLIDHVEMPGLEGTGRARYLASLGLVHDGFSDYHEEIELVVADEDKAVSYARITGTHDGDLMGLPPTGRKVDFRVMGILRFADGQAVERWGVSDTLTQMQQLGLLA
jgi:predicted ester cyclase